jgi:hypothetical protein
MKKIFILVIPAAVVVFFSNCRTKKITATPPKITYQANIQTLLINNCSPCHFPEKNGNKKPLNNYTAVKENIDEMIHRVGLNPGEKGFMPFKHPKLSDSTVTVLKQWRDNGMPEN